MNSLIVASIQVKSQDYGLRVNHAQKTLQKHLLQLYALSTPPQQDISRTSIFKIRTNIDPGLEYK